MIGHWKEAAELCERAAEVLRDQCTGATWELTVANRFMLTSLMFLGELTEVARRVPQLLNAALEQGNLFAATDLRTRLNGIWLAADDPDTARNEVIQAMMVWPREGFHLQHYMSLAALAQIDEPKFRTSIRQNSAMSFSGVFSRIPASMPRRAMPSLQMRTRGKSFRNVVRLRRAS